MKYFKKVISAISTDTKKHKKPKKTQIHFLFACTQLLKSLHQSVGPSCICFFSISQAVFRCTSHLYERVCQSICQSVCRSVGPSRFCKNSQKWVKLAKKVYERFIEELFGYFYTLWCQRSRPGYANYRRRIKSARIISTKIISARIISALYI